MEEIIKIPKDHKAKIEGDKNRLQSLYDSGRISPSDLKFGRKIHFGKYKGEYIFFLLAAHPYYMDWVMNNTQFTLNETEIWWRAKADLELELIKADRLIYALKSQMRLGGMDNEDNPHAVVE